MRILVFNAGSSSLKFELRAVTAAAGHTLLAGAFTDFAPSGARFAWSAGTRRGATQPPVATLGEAARWLLGQFALPAAFGLESAAIDAVAHRVVHGGEQFLGPTRLDAAAIASLEAISPLAPLHNPPALEVIRQARLALGETLPQVAVFDTAYYAQLPEAARQYAIPRDWRERLGVRRYGFHGIAHRFLCRAAAAHLAAAGAGSGAARVVSLQLGRGCSVTGSLGMRAIVTSMGFTPLEGLVMGTRCGDIDAGAVLHVMQREGLSPEAMGRALNERSGLAALSGRSGDMRELLALAAGGDHAAQLAIEVFCQRARHHVGAALAELGGADAIVFGGGIGENCPQIRARIVGELGWAGILLDADANERARGAAAVHAGASRAALLVVAVDEASLIAADAAALLQPEG